MSEASVAFKRLTAAVQETVSFLRRVEWTDHTSEDDAAECSISLELAIGEIESLLASGGVSPGGDGITPVFRRRIDTIERLLNGIRADTRQNIVGQYAIDALAQVKRIREELASDPPVSPVPGDAQ